MLFLLRKQTGSNAVRRMSQKGMADRFRRRRVRLKAVRLHAQEKTGKTLLEEALQLDYGNQFQRPEMQNA